MSSVGIALDPAQIHEPAALGAAPGVGSIVVDNAKIRGEVDSTLVYFPLLPGTVIPAWQQITFTKGSRRLHDVVDAATRDPALAEEHPSHASTQNARFSVYVQADGMTPASPAPHAPTTQAPGAGTQFPEIARTIVSMFTVQNLTASPNGWIPDGGTTTTGNNVDAYLDLTDGDTATAADGLDDNGRPIGNPDASADNRDFLGAAPRDYAYTPAPLGGNPDAGDRADEHTLPAAASSPTSSTSPTGTTTSSTRSASTRPRATSRQTNFGGVGSATTASSRGAGRRLGTNNANFSTPPDGTSGPHADVPLHRPDIDRDGGLDADIVAARADARHQQPADRQRQRPHLGRGGGMGEGWSDFYRAVAAHTTPTPTTPTATTPAAPTRPTSSAASPTTTSTASAASPTPPTTRQPARPGPTSTTSPTTSAAASPRARSTSTATAAGRSTTSARSGRYTLWEVRSRVIADRPAPTATCRPATTRCCSSSPTR